MFVDLSVGDTKGRLLDSVRPLRKSKQVSEVISKMHDEGHISEKNRNYVLVDQPKVGRFYLLPKIHKADNLGRSKDSHSERGPLLI